jgi:ATP-dependent Lon protease
VILPADNRQNVEEDLTPAQTEGVTIHYASRVEEVLAAALPLLHARPQDAVAAEVNSNVLLGQIA